MNDFGLDSTTGVLGASSSLRRTQELYGRVAMQPMKDLIWDYDTKCTALNVHFLGVHYTVTVLKTDVQAI